MSPMSWRLPRARNPSRSVTSRDSTVTRPARNDGTSGPAIRGDDDLASEVVERSGGVGADHAEPAGDQDHRTTSNTLLITDSFRGFFKRRRDRTT